jgi:hypothetical protein
LIFNRRLLITSHTVLAFFSALAFLSRLNFTNYPYWRYRSAMGVLLIAAPPLVPYVLSAIHSWHALSERRIGLFLFLAVLVVGTIFGVPFMVGAFDVVIDGEMMFFALALQTMVYFAAGHVLLRGEWL